MRKILSRSNAIKEGSKFYFTGKPCCNGHINERYAPNGCCVECIGIRERERRAREKQSFALGKAQKIAEHLASLKPITFLEASKAGLKRYFTGDPCELGHIDERYVNGGHCLECHRISARRSTKLKKYSIETCNRIAARPDDVSHLVELANLAPEKLCLVISRKDAAIQHRKRFYTGEPCLRGHIDERYVLSGNCVRCQRTRGKGESTAKTIKVLSLDTLISNSKIDNALPNWDYVSRDDARKAGLKGFFIGKMCKNGHVAIQNVGNMECRTCSAERKRNHYANDEEYRKNYKITSAERNRQPAVREYRNAKAREYYKTPQFMIKLRERLRTDIKFAISERIKTLLRNGLRKRQFKKTSRLQDILGCSMDQFIRHIELQFLPGMNWENRNLWEFDHIVPLSVARSEQEVFELWHHTNLRPLWQIDNRSKGNKLLFLI